MLHFGNRKEAIPLLAENGVQQLRQKPFIRRILPGVKLFQAQMLAMPVHVSRALVACAERGDVEHRAMVGA